MTQPALPPPRGDLAFLAHRDGDDVAVAVRDTTPGEAIGACMDTGARFGITVQTAIPFGHKVALRDIAENETVTEYGEAIGLARLPVVAGELVHTHNLRSARWQKSV